jgi:hypothetical protein
MYGNYGGPRYGDFTFKTQPIDELDREFMIHDALYAHFDETVADELFLTRLGDV